MADHLSRLHIPRGGDIDYTFPEEHLLAISSHAPWYARIMNFNPRALESSSKKISSSMISSTIFRKNHSYSTKDTIRSFDDAYQRRSKEISWRCVTHRRAEEILQRARLRTKSYRAASTGPPSSRTPTVSIRNAYSVKRHETSPSEMRCQCGRTLK